MSRKDQLAPYEVMGRKSVQETPSDSESSASSSSLPFESQRGPMIFRIPQGYAWALGVAFLGLMGLAYAAGYTRGDRARQNKIQAAQQQEDALIRRAATLRQPPSGELSGGINPNTTTNANTVTKETYKPTTRQPGFNYFVLVHYPRAEAQELVAFLAEYGVEATAISVHNTRFKVVALKGYRGGERKTDHVQEYEQLLRRLGRLWKNKRQGAGDLGDMYPERYDGPTEE